MIAWYSRDRSSFNLSISSFRVRARSLGPVAVAILDSSVCQLSGFDAKRGSMPEGVDFTLPAGREVGVIGFSFCIIIRLMSIGLMREGFRTVSTAAALALSTSLLTAQTRITPPANKY